MQAWTYMVTDVAVVIIVCGGGGGGGRGSDSFSILDAFKFNLCGYVCVYV